MILKMDDALCMMFFHELFQLRKRLRAVLKQENVSSGAHAMQLLDALFVYMIQVHFKLLSPFPVVSIAVWISLFSLVLIAGSIYSNRLQNTGALNV